MIVMPLFESANDLLVLKLYQQLDSIEGTGRPTGGNSRGAGTRQAGTVLSTGTGRQVRWKSNKWRHLTPISTSLLSLLMAIQTSVLVISTLSVRLC